MAHGASPMYRLAPYAMFSCMLLACMIIPTLSTNLPLAPAADAIALVGLFALARLFISLAAMDVGTAFGTMGARREMLVGFLAEPAFLMVALHRLAHLQLDLARDHRGKPRPPRAHHPAQPRLRGRGLHHGLARGKRARSRGQPRHAPRAHDDPRGAAPRVLGPPPRAHGMGRVVEALRLFVRRAGALLPVGDRGGQRPRGARSSPCRCWWPSSPPAGSCSR